MASKYLMSFKYIPFLLAVSLYNAYQTGKLSIPAFKTVTPFRSDNLILYLVLGFIRCNIFSISGFKSTKIVFEGKLLKCALRKFHVVVLKLNLNSCEVNSGSPSQLPFSS